MSDEVVVTPAGNGFAVHVVTAGTEHQVSVSTELLQAAGGDGERLVRESFGFLLEREPATSILSSFSLDVISRYFPEYDEEIRRRLAAGG